MKTIREVVFNQILARSAVFRTTDLASRARVSTAVASRALGGLARANLVARVTKGVWAAPENPLFSPFAVVPYLFTEAEAPRSYVSFLSALHLHEMVSQIPGAIHVATGRQRRTLHTAVGTFRFHCLQPALLRGFAEGDRSGRFMLATPTKALFDTLYVSARRGKAFRHLPEITIPRTATDHEMQRWLLLIKSKSTRELVNRRWRDLLSHSQERSVRGQTWRTA